MNVNLINDIINDYSKIYDDLFRKRYSSLNELLDKTKQDLNFIKEKISSEQMNEEKTKDNILSEKTKNLISCIKELLENKLNNKYIISFLNILKKCFQYKLWSKSNSHDTIEIMKEISSNPKSSIECLNKLVEIIHTILFTSFFDLNENDAINIYLINLKNFCNTNNYQNYNFKNPIRLLFIALTDIIYKSNKSELIINITKFLFSLYIKDDENNSDNEYLEIIQDIKNNTYIKCLSLELISQGLKILKEKNININGLEDIINNKIILVIKSNLSKIINNRINSDQEYIHLLKLLRIVMIIINNYNIDYSIIILIISFLGKENYFKWQNNLSMESLQGILSNDLLIISIYSYKKDLISEIFNTLGIVYDQNKNNYLNINQSKPNKKQIEKNIIFLEGDEVSIIKENELNNNIIYNIKECVQNTINSFSSIMNKYKISLNGINKELSKEQEIIKEIISLSSDIFKQILFDLINKEYNNDDFEESVIQKTINCMQNIIVIYSCLNLMNIRNEYLNEICNLCIQFNSEKNTIVCSSILNLSKYTQFFDKKDFVLIFKTIEKIYINYNNNSKENFDLIIENIFKSYQRFYSENDLNNKDIEYKNEKKEKENLLITGINNIFIDSKSLNITCLKNILEALFECLKFEINEVNKDRDKNEIIIFYLTKLLTLSLLNIENIYYIFDDYIIPIINLLKQKQILINFTINLISSIIKEILINHEKIISKLSKETNNNNWLLNPKWQKKLFESLVSFTIDKKLIELSKNRLLICIKAIIEQSGNYIDLFGWESIIKICQILINENVEDIFLIIKLILNDYNAYLTIFNVMPIITLLGIFISYQKDKNICFNSIELFWSCANIVEKFHKGKIDINEKQKKIYEELLKEEKSENFDIFYSGLYYKIFSQLLRINSDFRYDIRKNGINIFTEIFLSKMNIIEYEKCFGIINDIFFNIFSINSKKYIEKEKSFSLKANEQDIHVNKIPKKDKELEQTLHSSLLSMIKILKSFPNNIEIKSEINQLDNIFTLFLKKLIDIIPFGRISLNSDILHGLSEMKNIKTNNKYLLFSKVDIFFEIMDKFNEFFHSEKFKLTPYNKMKCLKLLNNLLTNMIDFFGNESNYDIFNIQKEQIFSKIADILEFIFYGNSIIEQKTLFYSPQRLTEIEENIFNFVQNIPIINEQYLFDYIMKHINYDINMIHSGALCHRAIECLIYIINKNENNCYILKQDNKNYLKQYFDKFKDLFNKLNNDNIKNYFINNKTKFDFMFNDLIKVISQFFLIIINKTEFNHDEIILNIVEFYQNIFEQVMKEIELMNEELHLKERIDIYNKFIQVIIHSLFIELLPIIFACFYEKENEVENITNKLLKLIHVGCYKINNSTNENIDKQVNESTNKIFITNLFSICKYQSKQEILDTINKSKLKNIKEEEFIKKFVEFKIKLTTLLITKLNENLKEYKDNYQNKKEEIIFLLNNINNLEVFPELIENEDIKDNDNNKENNPKRKIHIFYLYQNIIEFLSIENKDIHLLIKEIITKAFDIIQTKIPPLPNFFQKEK